MMLGAFIPPPPPNVHRVVFPQFSKTLPKDYPQILRGIMQEGEYVDYIKRIEKDVSFSKKYMLIIIFPFIFIIPGIACIVATGNFVFFALLAIGFVAFAACGIANVIITIVKSKKAMEKLGEILTEINTRYYPRGVKWAYNTIRTGKNSSYQYIDIITFPPGAADAPPMDGVIFQSPHYSVAPGAGYSAAGAPQQSYPAAPPPSKEAYVGVDINSENVDGPNPYATYNPPANPYGAVYPSAPPPQQQQPPPGTYPGNPAYPGDPNNPYGY